MSSFKEIMINDLTDCEKFTRKHLLNMHEKYRNIWNAFKTNDFSIAIGDEPRIPVLTKQEKVLVDEEIEEEISKAMFNNTMMFKREATAIVLQRIRQELKPLYAKIYNLEKALPAEILQTHYKCECGSNVVISNKSYHLKTVKHLNFVNKVEPMPKEPKEPKVEAKVECGCGKSFSSKNKSHHNKTQYHLDWERTTKEEFQSFCL